MNFNATFSISDIIDLLLSYPYLLGYAAQKGYVNEDFYRIDSHKHNPRLHRYIF